MKAFVDGQEVPLQEISMDDQEWDHRRYHGTVALQLHFGEGDLLALGRLTFAEAQEARAEDPYYFEGNFSHLPVPKSEKVFLEKPELIGVYLTAYDYWSYPTICNIVGLLDSPRGPGTKHRYIIVEYRGISIENGETILTLGAGPQW